MDKLLSEELAKAAELDEAEFDSCFAPGKYGNVNGRSVRDCPPGHIMFRQPPSSEHDIRVTIPASFMQEWKPVAWAGAGLKDKKVMVLIHLTVGGLFALKPVAPDRVGKGVYRLEQNAEDGQARFMTTRRYLGRQMNEQIEYVPFEIRETLGMMDLNKLKSLD